MLEVQGLDATYGELRALAGVGLRVGADEIVALVGANGAGKTTLLRCITGLTRPRAGRILWQSQDLGGLPPHRVVERGVAMVPEGRRLFGHMTVEENLSLGAFGSRARPERQATLDRIYGIFPRLARAPQAAGGRAVRRRAADGGDRARAHDAAAPPHARRALARSRAARWSSSCSESSARSTRRGSAILLVEQNVRAALGLAHRAYVLEHGRVVGQGTGAEILADPARASRVSRTARGRAVTARRA